MKTEADEQLAIDHGTGLCGDLAEWWGWVVGGVMGEAREIGWDWVVQGAL